MNELALFAGAGGGILGGHLLGWRTVCAVEIEDYPRRVLLQRQADGILPRFPIWDDVCTFDGNPWKGKIDVITGGFPCTDISSAGKGAGITGEKSGLWTEMARIIGEVLPRFVFVENSPMLTSRGLGTVLGDLSEMGYDAEWGILGAHHAGAPHKRDRIWVLAYSISERGPRWNAGRENAMDDNTSGKERVQDQERICGEDGIEGPLSNTNEDRRDKGRLYLSEEGSYGPIGSFRWSVEPAVGRVAHGVANRVDRLKAIGNGQVSIVVALAWTTLYDRIFTQSP